MKSQTTMTSKERLLKTLEHKPTDHIPLYLRFWSLGGTADNIPFAWKDQVQRVENTLALGLDDTLLLEPPMGYVEEYRPEKLPEVHSHTRVIPPSGEESYPLLTKVFETPLGPLQTTVKKDSEWPYGDDVHLFDDFNVPRFKEPLVKTCDDITRLRGLLADAPEEQLAEFRQRAGYLRQQAGRLGVALDGGWIALGDAVVWLIGMERLLYAQMLEPDFIQQLLDVLFEWEMKRIDLLIAEGIDVLVHMGWYEGTDFWTPKNYRAMLKPRLSQMIAKAHAHGVKYRYIITKGWKPLRNDFLEMEIDCLTGLDPVQDRLDLSEIKSEIGGKICLMGGVNSAVMLSQWSKEQILQALEEAFHHLSPGGGFILYPVDAIFNDQPWDKVAFFIERWKERCAQTPGSQALSS